LFKAFAILLIDNDIAVNKVAKIIKVCPARIWTIFNYWISICPNQDSTENLKKVEFNETSVKKGHENYVESRISNRTIEEINAKIQLAK